MMPISEKTQSTGAPNGIDGQRLINVIRRATNTEIILAKVKMPLPDIMAAVLALDESALNADQVENLMKFCPTSDGMDLLENYTGNKESLGKCEQFFLERTNVPRVNSKLQVLLFKIQFNSQITDLRKKLATVNATCEEVRNSIRLKEIMKKLLILGNVLNQGTPRGREVGFKLYNFRKLLDKYSTNNKMTVMHYLCRHVATKSPELIDFYEDFEENIEAASKIKMESLAEETHALNKGLDKLKMELVASENDGPVYEPFRKSLKCYIGAVELEVKSLLDFHSVVREKVESLPRYFGEDPFRCPYERVIQSLLDFIRVFRQSHEDNLKRAEKEAAA